MKKPHLIILSDIHGKSDNDWIGFYIDKLSLHFQLEYLDSVSLAELSAKNNSKVETHAQLISGGIDQAVSNLMKLRHKNTFILAFSIGGTIAWKAALKGFSVHKLVAVSSTRLRKEYQKPKCEIELYFGESDMNRPKDEWFEEIELQPTIFRSKNHEMYHEQDIAETIISNFLESIQV